MVKSRAIQGNVHITPHPALLHHLHRRYNYCVCVPTSVEFQTQCTASLGLLWWSEANIITPPNIITPSDLKFQTLRNVISAVSSSKISYRMEMSVRQSVCPSLHQSQYKCYNNITYHKCHDNITYHKCHNNITYHKYHKNIAYHKCHDNITYHKCHNNIRYHKCHNNITYHKYHNNIAYHKCHNNITYHFTIVFFSSLLST